MPFKSDEQRKGFFANRANSKGAINPQKVGRFNPKFHILTKKGKILNFNSLEEAEEKEKQLIKKGEPQPIFIMKSTVKRV